MPNSNVWLFSRPQNTVFCAVHNRTNILHWIGSYVKFQVCHHGSDLKLYQYSINLAEVWYSFRCLYLLHKIIGGFGYIYLFAFAVFHEFLKMYLQNLLYMFDCIWNILDIFCTAETQCVGSSKQPYMAVGYLQI